MSGIFSRKVSSVLPVTAAQNNDAGSVEGVQLLRRAGFVGALAMAVGAAFSKEAPAAELSPMQALQDRAEIANLISALTFADDRHDPEGFAGAFVPDGVLNIMDPKSPRYAKGRDAIQQFVRGPAGPRPGGPTSGIRHINFNNYIQIVDRTHARHWGYWMSVRNSAAPRDDNDIKFFGIVGQDLKILGCGAFDDDLVKVDGRWYFQVHRLRFDTVNPNPA